MKNADDAHNPGDQALEVIYKDADLLAVNKPAGISTIPDRSPDRIDMRGVVEDYLHERVWVVHRLDKPVSGVLIFARNAAMHKRLGQLFESRQVKKEYLALVHGRARGIKGRIDAPIRTFGSGRVGVDEARGKRCRTDFRIIEAGPEYSLLHVFPLTGRRHQIRAHLYSIGHPVVGDPRYGEKTLQQGYSSLMLHASRLRFSVENDSEREITANPPDNFVALLRILTGWEYTNPLPKLETKW